jgi:uncharacterized Rmd1/YagE family protein
VHAVLVRCEMAPAAGAAPPADMTAWPASRRLEWIVIILIVIEIGVALVELFNMMGGMMGMGAHG